MKANELMLGDWVLCGGTPFQVCGLKSEDKTIYGGMIPYRENEVEPIPLTAVILEKNGFHYGNTASEEDFCGAVGCGYPDKGWCFDEGAGEIKIIFPNETDGGLIRLDDQNGDKHLELIFCNPIMVNELQHALRLCGIEKEIII